MKLFPHQESVPINGYEGLYDVDILGNVYSLVQNRSRRICVLKPYNHNGYRRVNLYDSRGFLRKKYVHRLVAEAFLGLTDRYVVNHIDGDKSNNSLANLQVCNQKENIHHSHILELQVRPVPTHVDNVRYRNMRLASISLGLKPYTIAHYRRKYGNQFVLKNKHIKCGDDNVQV